METLYDIRIILVFISGPLCSSLLKVKHLKCDYFHIKKKPKLMFLTCVAQFIVLPSVLVVLIE